METFVVRVFVAADAAPIELAGIVEHVATGTAKAFRGPSDLIGVVLHELGRDGEAASEPPTSPRKRKEER